MSVLKILLDALCMTKKIWPVFQTLVWKLEEQTECEVSVICPHQVQDNVIEQEKKMSAYPWLSDTDDLSQYDVFITASSYYPEWLGKYPYIISVAFLITPYAFAALPMEEMEGRFWEKYDYVFTFTAPGKDPAMEKALGIPERKLILGDLGEKAFSLDQIHCQQEELDLVESAATPQSLIPLIETLEQTLSRKNNQPLVTIVTITYNLVKNKREEMIRQCIESVHNQTYPNIEHLIIDGGSGDGTQDLFRKYQEDGWIQVYSEPDKGLYDAMNKGIRRAKGKYVAFINSDDYYYHEKAVEYAVMVMEMYGVRYSFGDARAMCDNGDLTMWVADVNLLPYAMNYCHQTMFVQTELLREMGGFDISYKVSADSDIMIRLYAMHEPYCIIRYPSVMYRLGGLSSTSSDISCKDHSRTFYLHIGKQLGLTMQECENIWAMRFLHICMQHEQYDILRKLGQEFSIRRPLEEIRTIQREQIPLKAAIVLRLKQKVKGAVKRTGIVRISIEETEDREIKWYKLFGVIPVYQKWKKIGS